MGRRVEKVADGVTKSYTYDDARILRDIVGGANITYAHGPGIDVPLQADDNNTVVYFHADALGSIVKTTNAAGGVSLTRQYDAWGDIEIGEAEPGYAFTGREWDPEVGLYYYRARYYDSEMGRFISEDPIGFDGGGNFYSYVENSPVDVTDPSGLCGLGGCNAKVSPTRPEPTEKVYECVAPEDFPCPCPMVQQIDRTQEALCVAGGGQVPSMNTGSSGGPPPVGAYGYSRHRKTARVPNVLPPRITKPQGARACAFALIGIVAASAETCREKATRCVMPAWAK